MQQLTYLDHLRIIATNRGILLVLLGLAVAGYGLFVVVQATREERRPGTWERLIGGVLLLAAGLLWAYLQTLVPTRYATNPVAGRSPEEIAAAARPIYAQHCAACHGPKGLGDGPLAEFVTPPPANFSIHGWHHKDGEHYWWITRGIPGTSMPSFGDFLTDEERWLLARYVKQLGREARLP